MQDLNDFYYYVQVVDHRGFAPAVDFLAERFAAIDEDRTTQSRKGAMPLAH